MTKPKQSKSTLLIPTKTELQAVNMVHTHYRLDGETYHNIIAGPFDYSSLKTLPFEIAINGTLRWDATSFPESLASIKSLYCLELATALTEEQERSLGSVERVQYAPTQQIRHIPPVCYEIEFWETAQLTATALITIIERKIAWYAAEDMSPVEPLEAAYNRYILDDDILQLLAELNNHPHLHPVLEHLAQTSAAPNSQDFQL